MNAKSYIATALATVAIYGGASLTVLCAANVAHAAEATVTTVAMTDTAKSGDFTKRTYGIQGDWKIVKENGQTILRLSDDFKTKRGPDLKIFLSPQTLDSVTGTTATANSVRLGELKSNKGTQDYVIPANIDLSQFGSVLIHCEAFSKLWGGADL